MHILSRSLSALLYAGLCTTIQSLQITRSLPQETTLLQAAKDGNLGTIHKLFEAEQAPYINTQNADENTPLMIAAVQGDAEALQIFIIKGADLNIRNKAGDTAIMLAVKRGYAHVTKKLLLAGAHTHIRNKEGANVLEVAGVNGNMRQLATLLKTDADINNKNIYGNTPLMVAVLNDRTKPAQLFIQSGANVNERNQWDQSALLYAIRNKNLALAQKLIATPGADISSLVNGSSPLMWALNKGAFSIAHCLAAAGADVFVLDNQGNNALRYITPRKDFFVFLKVGAHKLVEQLLEEDRFAPITFDQDAWIQYYIHRYKTAYQTYLKQKQQALPIISSATALESRPLLTICEYAYGPSIEDLPPSDVPQSDANGFMLPEYDFNFKRCNLDTLGESGVRCFLTTVQFFLILLPAIL